MVSSELVVLLIVCVGINTAQQQPEIICQNQAADRTCNYNLGLDTGDVTQCLSTTLNCVKNNCTAVINNEQRNCQNFIDIPADASVDIHCCLCTPQSNATAPTNLIWDCSNVTVPSPLPLTTALLKTEITTAFRDNKLSMVTTTDTTTVTTTTNIGNTILITIPVVTIASDTSTADSTNTSNITPTMVITPKIAMKTDVIISVVVVLVVCLLVVCVIATIIILYYRAKHHQQQTTKPTQLDNIAGITDNEPTMTCDNSELYSRTTHINTPPCNTVPSPGEYSEITDKEQLAGYSVIDGTTKKTNEEIPDANYSVINEEKDANIEGLVYSAVVSQDGKKNTVKTTAVLDDSQQQQQSVPDTSIEGLVYSAVVVKDGTKTTVKTTVFKD